MTFAAKKFRSKKEELLFQKSLAGRYKSLIAKNPFLYYGLPFCLIMGLGSYWLSNFTAMRYERRDKKVQAMNEEEVVKLKTNRRTVDIKEEYYKLQGLAEQDWEPIRVPRFKGESENVWDVK
ncbi:HHR007Cp [Eremothecium sinecaudum]|uniref:Cytochrome c oxidase assembly protein COX16, mitochondrial n=1 Tax=Eremothecium sinecaudum TaxID=45286 RepID=A0A0X8HWG9_9SACH|nr:HHR007Cp [Eremothecium sinecaudum]AMD22776.1 HHR007Cp [Eremothecium sinecaudum]